MAEATICMNPVIVERPPARRAFEIEGYIQLDTVTDESVFFNSKFESGNLRQAFKVPPTEQSEVGLSEYNLYLTEDTNTDTSLTQWFYFSVHNLKSANKVRLHIMNLMKDDSLYSSGMQPFVFSERRWRETGVGWHRGGADIVYDSSGGQTIRTCSKTLDLDFDPSYVDSVQDKYKQQSRLSFTYLFEYEHDTVFFSHFVPYTYSDLT